MNICYIIRKIPPDFSGAGIRAYRQAKMLLKHNFVVSILTCTKTESSEFNIRRILGLINTIESKLIKILILPVYFIQLFFLIKKKYDVVFCVAGGTSAITILSLIICKLKNIKCIVGATRDGSDDPQTMYKGKFGHILKYILNFSHSFIYISPIFVDRHKSIGLDDKNVYLIPNSVNISEFYPINDTEKTMLKKRLKFDKYEKLIVTVGEVSKRKGTREIIENFPHILSKYSETALIIVGPKDLNNENIQYTAEIENLILKLGLENHVFLLGNQPNVNEWMRISDIFIFNSVSEGFPNVIIESFASGLPVVSRKIDGITEYIITHGKNGFIFENYMDAIHHMLKIMEDIKFRDDIIHNAINSVYHHYTTEIVMEKYIEVFRN